MALTSPPPLYVRNQFQTGTNQLQKLLSKRSNDAKPDSYPLKLRAESGTQKVLLIQPQLSITMMRFMGAGVKKLWSPLLQWSMIKVITNVCAEEACYEVA